MDQYVDYTVDSCIEDNNAGTSCCDDLTDLHINSLWFVMPYGRAW